MRGHLTTTAVDGHDHDDFDTFSVEVTDSLGVDALLRRLSAAIVEHDVLRLKGFAAHSGQGHALADSGGGYSDSALLRPRLARRRKPMHPAGGDRSKGSG